MPLELTAAERKLVFTHLHQTQEKLEGVYRALESGLETVLDRPVEPPQEFQKAMELLNQANGVLSDYARSLDGKPPLPKV